VLLELPWNPELLEQRIGRLDRIGQKHPISIHVPVISGSANELLCRWFHEGVNAFEKNVPAAATVFETMEPRLRSLMRQEATESMDDIIKDTRARAEELSATLFTHRDYLLEFASNAPERVRPLIESLLHRPAEDRLDEIMVRLFSHYGIKLEEAGSNRYALITEYCTDHSFPLPRSERPVITYDRETACAYDTVEFLTIDHPMVTGGLELFLSSPQGTSSFALWNDMTTNELLLESLYMIECIAPPHLRLFRFFTPHPLRIVVNHLQELVTDRCPPAVLKTNCKNGPVRRLLAQKQIIDGSFPKLLSASDAFSKERLAPLISEATDKMRMVYREERERLLHLRTQGAMITDRELRSLDKEEEELAACLAAIRLRRDAIRLIWRGTVRGG
jgi:ATP-dependent helicase HepA